MNPIISFITPVYNTKEYVAECIESVLNQTYPNWELILIDDGSSDNSGAICDDYAKRDSRITVIHHHNSGQLVSRIKGIECAKGEYCTGLDSDDYLERNCVEVLTKTLASNPCDIIGWNIRQVLNGKEIARESYDYYGAYKNYDYLLFASKTSNHSFCNKLIRTELMRESFYGTLPDSRTNVDYIQICPSICMAQRIFTINEVLYNYRQIESSVTHATNGKHVVDILNSVSCIFEIVDHYGMMVSEFETAEYSCLVKTIGFHLKRALKQGSISKVEKTAIHRHPIYNSLRKYESFKYMPLDLLVAMKLFRYNLERVLYR